MSLVFINGITTKGHGWENDVLVSTQTFKLDTTTSLSAITDPLNPTVAATAHNVVITTVDGKSIVTITPPRDLDFATHYKISIDAGAFTGVSGQKSSAIISRFGG